ncbi:MAG: hypothetical protein DHS20C18_45230 [Saprospiraceae bacterium]|nr:MAG: hypothetical protein DHS20C18_45230 [Saprospiraceae bacterium]
MKSVIESTEVDIPIGNEDLYGNLIKAITYQQSSGKAAATIYGRFLDLFPDNFEAKGNL